MNKDNILHITEMWMEGNLINTDNIKGIPCGFLEEQANILIQNESRNSFVFNTLIELSAHLNIQTVDNWPVFDYITHPNL